MPEAYGYIRVSHDEQVESGLSLEAQEQIAHGFWQRNLQGKGLEWGGLWADEAVSAFKRPLLRRPNGQKFVTVAKPGDHIVVTRFDRCFRSMLDFVNTFRLLGTRGIILHILDAPGRLRHRQRPGHAPDALRLRGMVQPDYQRTQPSGGGHSPPTGPAR